MKAVRVVSVVNDMNAGKGPRHRLFTPAVWRGEGALALLLAALAFGLAASGWTWRGDRVVYDFALTAWSRPPPPDIVIVAIDDASIDAIGRWPWPRAVHSTLLDKLSQAQPRAIGLDLILSEADPDPAQDRLLAQVLRRAAPVVLPVAWQPGVGGLPPRLLAPVAELQSATLLGAIEPAVDADGVLRHAFLHTGLAGTAAQDQAPLAPVMRPHAQSPPYPHLYPHMALALLHAGGETLDPRFAAVTETSDAVQDNANSVGSGGLRDQRFLIRYAGPPGHVLRVSYVELLRGAVKPDVLKGRYVLIGMTALGLGDTLATPVNRDQHAMPGVEVLANTLYTLRSGDTVRALPRWPAAALAGALLLLLVPALKWVGARWALLLALAVVPLTIAASLLAVGAGLWWSPLPCALAAALAYPLWSWRRLEQTADSLDMEIRKFEHEGGLAAPHAPQAWARFQPRDRLALRLDSLQAATDTVRSARRFLADALAGMPTAMLVADQQGRVLLANTLTAKLFETATATAMQGLDLAGLLVEFHTPQPVDWQALLDRTDTPPDGVAVEAQLARRGDLWLHFASVSLLGQQRWVVTLVDVTAIKQAQRRRDETLAFVTHDLRSPASSIMLLADMQLQGQSGLAPDALLTEIHRLAARALELSDDIVRVAHAESRPLNLAPTPVAALLDEVLVDLRPQAQSANVRLRAAPHGMLAAVVMDRALVLRALGNLVSNAIKHSPRDGLVEVRAAVDAQDPGVLVISVRDSGAGLSAQQLHKLRSESQGLPAGDARGVGLGLLFVQRVAARHRGRLLARAGERGRGTVFELQLQMAAPPAAAEAVL